MLCFLIGSLAIASVKRQKRLTASLFDQRKQGTAAADSGGPSTSSTSIPNKKRSNFITENDEEIEFTPMTNQQIEKVPLMEIKFDDDLEVV